MKISLLNFFERRRYFKKQYSEMYDAVSWLYRSFCNISMTYVVNEDNIEQFNQVKNGIVKYAKELCKSLKLLDNEISWNGEISRRTKKKREKARKKIQEILKLFG